MEKAHHRRTGAQSGNADVRRMEFAGRDAVRGWAVPIDPAARVMHAGDVTEVGRAVAAALADGDQLPDGSYLGVCGGVYSFNDFVGTLNGQGHKLQVLQVPPAVYDGFYPGNIK
jgi:hypothetical protein